jgi:5'-phosphate synthase pdxT subunit
MLEKAGANAVPVRRPTELTDLNGLVLPGGESTTIGHLMKEEGFFEPLTSLVKENLFVFGTCAGLVLVAREVLDGTTEQPHLGLMNIKVRRNAYGRQRESFEEDIEVKGFKKPYRAIFIRSPWIEEQGEEVEVLAEYQGRPVLARQKNILVSAFHPELSSDVRVHKFFLEMIKQRGE